MGSWEKSEKWYSKLVGEKGHHYHQTVLLPNILRLLPKGSLLDVGCGQGVLARSVKNIEYWGIDASSSLIKEAKRLTPKGHFFTADAAEKSFPFEKSDFDSAIFLLSLQNMEHPEKALNHAAARLKQGGKLILILNHPCFRIPRQSSWGIDEAKKLQYRRIDRYMSKEKIPIQTHPGKKDSAITYSYHHPLSDFVKFLGNAGCCILSLEEWCSDKESSGAKAKMENRARREIPLFLAIVARKEANI